MAVVVTVAKGYDLGYIWKTQGEAAEHTIGGYYLNAAQAGEPPGRWWGPGAQALGFTPGQIVQREPYDAVYRQIDPRTGARLGRPRGRYPTFADHLARLTAAEPHATAERLIELEREAAQATRQPAAYTDVTISFSKSISVLHASIRENERRARLAGDQQAAAYWAGREQSFQEILHRANRAALEYLQAWAGVTRTGYHGTRVDGREPGRFEPAGLIVTSWLQGTSRDGDPQDHIHNQIARITRTFSDGKWRALDTASLRAVLGALQAVAATAVECELTREFGVDWIPRADGRGNEIKGITQAQMDAYSTRTVQVHEKERELARAWERRHGRAPTSRELLHIANDATLQSRKGKDAGPVDWDALAQRWDATLGGELAGIAPTVSNARGPGVHGERASRRPRADRTAHARGPGAGAGQGPRPGVGPAPRLDPARPAQAAGAGPAARDPADEPGGSSGAAARPGRGGPVRTDRRGGVPGGTRMAAAPPVAAPRTGRTQRLHAARRRAVRHHRAADAGRQTRRARADARRAAAARRAGRAAPRRRPGAARGAAARPRARRARTRRAARAAAGPGRRRLARPHLAPHRRGDHRPGRHRQDPRPGHRRPVWDGPVFGTATSQNATNELRAAGVQVAANTTRLLADIQRGRIPPGSLIVADEGSMISITHLAALTEYAARNGCKLVLAGDQEQLAAVEGGGAMTLLADRLGYVQLAEPVRFTAAWERGASLRLRAGDATALDEYDQHGRIRGAPPDQAMDQAVHAYVASYLAGRDVLLMAADWARCRELSRADPRRPHPPRRGRQRPGRCGSPKVPRPRPVT